MTTITKERLLTIKQWRETYGPGSNVVLPAEEAEELARIALVSLEAEPVAKIIAHYPLGVDVGKQKFVQAIGELPDFGGYLFSAPPAPGVPEEATPENVEMLSGYVSTYKLTDSERDIAAEIWNACRTAMLQSGNFRENKNSSTNNFREIAETSTNYPAIPSEVLSAILKVARIRADFDDFDGDRRGIGDCLDEAEQELIVTINKYASQLAVEPVVPAVLERLRTIVADPRALPRRKEWVSGQQYSYVLLENVEAMVDEACHAAMLQGSQPVSQTYNLPELIEGMEVSIDVSTCDADLGNRYFGTVTEALELDTAKNGYILLVQDAEPNFDVNGNSPVTPDGWISCSERMPGDGQHVIILCDGTFVLYAQYRDGEFFDIVRNGDEFFETQSRNVTDWMPLPEPPQESKSE
ncbi:DUF551 domain-containing protein [Salmonella enterica subsp. enterica serovar Isangi]|nr:DUF551 domain-containing protein [Salmonella enterica subsp. enterica serovar Isangi]HAY0424167.1 DUF551 domain-containing protein [Escherichia coli]